ncbi:MAG: hypothetical protein ABIQ98_01275 [Sphingomicrobium sp.]
MSSRSSQAGGLFLMLAIVIGTMWGMASGQPMLGVLTGTGIGIVIAVGIWMVDRRR